MKNFILFTFIILNLESFASKKCEDLFISNLNHNANNLSEPEDETRRKMTEQFISYLTMLIEQNIIGNIELTTFLKGLEQNKWINPLKDKHQSPQKLIHYKGLQSYLDSELLNHNRLLTWTEDLLIKRVEASKRRAVKEKETQAIYQTIDFNPIPSGSFMMGKRPQLLKQPPQTKVTLSHDLEMMSTPVTQKQWVDLMDKNPSKFHRGPYSITIKRNGRLIQLQPDHPVESVTAWSMMVFANRLSEKHGLKPAYDLGDLNLKGAEDGNLTHDQKVVKFNSPDGTPYTAEGYRLPTSAEWEYVFSALGTSNSKYPLGIKSEDLPLYAWFTINSKSTTHPVAELKPFIVNSNPFYDLVGNVWERLHGESNMAPATSRPLVDPPNDPNKISSNILRGGSYQNYRNALEVDGEVSASPNEKDSNLSFRLVRTVFN